MAEIHIRRGHTMGIPAAKGKVDALARTLEKDLQASYRWNGDTLHFKRSGASGTIEVGSDYIAIHVKLGMALGLMKAKIEETVQTNLDQALGDSGSRRVT
jgi:putative polyhydroxyalkanoate system protein